jgi:conjugal transfer pilus assembly protein TrbC
MSLSSAWADKPFEVTIDSDVLKQAQHTVDAAQGNLTSDVLHDAQSVVNTIRTPEYQKRIKTLQHALRQRIGGAFKPAGEMTESTSVNNTQGDKKHNISHNSRVYVFISSAMSKRVLRKKIKAVAKIPNGVLVLRGFVGGAKTVTPTLKFIVDILKKEASCEGLACELYAVEVNIDPIRFARYGINRVPAVVYEPEEQFMGYCKGDALKKSSDRLVVYGEATLKYALETLQAEQPAPGLSDLIAQLEPTPWEYQKKTGRSDPEP